MAIILFLAAAILTLLGSGGYLFNTISIGTLLDILIPAAVLWILAILQTIFAVAGKKHKGANVCSIILGIILLPTYVGVFAIAGGIMGIYTCNANRTESADSASTAAATENVAVTPERQESRSPVNNENRSVSTEIPTAAATENDTVTPERQKSLDDYPIDYQNKPTVSPLFDRTNSGRLILKTGDSDETHEFDQLYITLYNDTPYVLCDALELDTDEGSLVLFRIDYENDALLIEQDVALFDVIRQEFLAADQAEQSARQSTEEQKIKRSDFTLDLYDVSIDEKTWKTFRKTAAQEDLAIIALGAKYRIVHSRIKNIIFTIGMLLSILLILVTEGFSLIGYAVLVFFLTKSIRYQDTFHSAYYKLNKENKALVNSYFKSNVALSIFDTITDLCIRFITIPYQAIMMLIGMFAPNFVIAKNGVLISIPNGYDVENLSAISDYYASFSFTDEVIAASEKSAEENKKHKITYQNGTDAITIDDRTESVEGIGLKSYKDDFGREYLSDDDGRTIRPKENDETIFEKKD